MELAFGRVIFERYGQYAADPEAIAVMLEPPSPTCRSGRPGSPEAPGSRPNH